MASTIYQIRIFHVNKYYRQYLLGIIVYLLISISASAQSGLQSIIVEKIPVSVEARNDDPEIPEGAFAYRVFVEMDTLYELQAIYALETHEVFIETSTLFYNNADLGATNGGDILGVLFESFPSLAFDSYITINAATNNGLGVLKSEDNGDGTVDGIISGTALPLQSLGENFDIPFGTESFSGRFSTFSGIYSVIGGESGPTTSNKVLIGQFTTDGELSFELNIQIRKKGTVEYEQYVAKDPQGQEILFEDLAYPGNMPPSITLTSPENGASFDIGEEVDITADASDVDGIASVAFFVNDIQIFVDTVAPYQTNWLSLEGNASILAIATDSLGLSDTTDVVIISVDDPTGLQDPDHDRSISVFPNPAKDNITLEFSGIPGHTTFQAEVTDLQGRSYLKQQIPISDNSYSTTIDISFLPAGVYIIRLVDENDRAMYKKMIKN